MEISYFRGIRKIYVQILNLEKFKKFFEWLYFKDDYKKTKIYKVTGINSFICDNIFGGRDHIWPVWDFRRFFNLIGRIKNIWKK